LVTWQLGTKELNEVLAFLYTWNCQVAKLRSWAMKQGCLIGSLVFISGEGYAY
jgi:hypothetical protein